MALGSTQPLTEMSTRCISWSKGGRCVRLTTLPLSCAVVTKFGNLNFLEPSGPLQACNGTALPFYDSYTALRPEWNETALRHAGNTSVEEHTLSVLAVHLTKRWRKYHLSHVVGKWTDQLVGHQWHHNTRLRKNDFGSCFRQFHEDYQYPINAIFL